MTDTDMDKTENQIWSAFEVRYDPFMNLTFQKNN